jgi:hypothetical protein
MDLQLLCEDGKQPGAARDRTAWSTLCSANEQRWETEKFRVWNELRKEKETLVPVGCRSNGNLPISRHPTIGAEFAGRKSGTGCD